MTGIELRALRRLRREQEPPSQFLFVSERGDPFSSDGFARMLQRVAETAGMTSLRIHPHMLRHACGFSSPMMGRTRERSKVFSATKIFSTPFAIRNWRRTDSKISGATEPLRFWKVPPIAGIVKLEPAPVGQTGAGKFQ